MEADAMWGKVKVERCSRVYISRVMVRNKTKKLSRGQVMKSPECHTNQCGCTLWVFQNLNLNTEVIKL